MYFKWISDGFSIDFTWISNGEPMDFQLISDVLSMYFKWISKSGEKKSKRSGRFGSGAQ